MNESEYKTKLVNTIRAEGGYARRIEDQFSVGFPDTIIIPKECRLVLFVEVKLIDGNIFRPRPRQKLELDRLTIPGVSLGMILAYHKVNKKTYIHESSDVVNINKDDPYVFSDTLSASLNLIAAATRYMKHG